VAVTVIGRSVVVSCADALEHNRMVAHSRT